MEKRKSKRERERETEKRILVFKQRAALERNGRGEKRRREGKREEHRRKEERREEKEMMIGTGKQTRTEIYGNTILTKEMRYKLTCSLLKYKLEYELALHLAYVLCYILLICTGTAVLTFR